MRQRRLKGLTEWYLDVHMVYIFFTERILQPFYENVYI